MHEASGVDPIWDPEGAGASHHAKEGAVDAYVGAGMSGAWHRSFDGVVGVVGCVGGRGRAYVLDDCPMTLRPRLAVGVTSKLILKIRKIKIR